MHIKPNTGILFLVLPSRCINSKHVGRITHFIDLLHGFNLVEVLPRRITPKLIFFILKYRQNFINSNNNNNLRYNDDDNYDHDSNDNVNDNVNVDDNHRWIEKIKFLWSDRKKNEKYKYFIQDLSHIPSNEFAITLPNIFIR